MTFSARLSVSFAVLAFVLSSQAAVAADDPVAAVRTDLARWGDVPVDDQGRSAYGLYLAGRAALSRGEAQAGAAYLASVQALAPDQTTLREQAFTSALLAGDLDLAARIAPQGEGVSPVVREAGKLVAAVRRFGMGDARTANAGLKASPIEAPHDRAAIFVTPWIAAAAGDWDRALAPAPAGADVLSTAFARYHRIQLLEIHRRYDEAEAELVAQSGTNPSAALTRILHGEFLERRGRRDEALAVYDAALAADAGNRGVRQARARLVARQAPPALPTLQQGAARALGAAAAAAAAERANEFAVVYLRLSLGLEASDETRGVLGQTLQSAGLDVASRATLAEIGTSRPDLYAASRLSIAFSLQQAERNAEALAEVRRAIEAAPDMAQANYVLASLLVEQEAYEEALTVLASPVLNTPDQSEDVRFLRGAAYESLGRIPEAEAELWAALQARPNDPTILNYLGYLWVDSGTRVAEGAEMIARAAAAQPEDGNIQDSLGWARYRQGQYEFAVETLEAAVEKEPANAEINDHLGDAYWQVGRQREAGFQWNRVLTLDPDQARREAVLGKLANGLNGAAEPMVTGTNP